MFDLTTLYSVCKLRFIKWLLLTSAGMATLAGPTILGGMTEQLGGQLQENSGARQMFEVASVKPNGSGTNTMAMFPSPGMLRISNYTVRRLIEDAYHLRTDQVLGGPGWIDSARYDIVAKPERKAPLLQMMYMLQSLLKNRFQLMTHRETRELPEYSLVVAKGGSKLQTSIERNKSHETLRIRDDELVGHDVSMERLARALSGQLNRPVIDRTGLNGGFDFTLQYVPDEEILAARDNAHSGPSIFTAIQEQLGLKLKAEKGLVEVLVIDHVEKPSAD